MTCTGSSAGNNDNCDCQQFIPKKSKEHRCQSCGHRLSSHTNIPSTPSELEEGEIPTKRHPPNYPERVYKSSKAASAFKNAQKETLQGYRPSLPPNSVCLLYTYDFVVLTLSLSLAPAVVQ